MIRSSGAPEAPPWPVIGVNPPSASLSLTCTAAVPSLVNLTLLVLAAPSVWVNERLPGAIVRCPAFSTQFCWVTKLPATFTVAVAGV